MKKKLFSFVLLFLSFLGTMLLIGHYIGFDDNPIAYVLNVLAVIFFHALVERVADKLFPTE